MAVYLVQGKLGAGKGKYVVGKMEEALRQGLRVATNMDLRLENMLRPSSKRTVLRVPDKPSAADLEALGHGNPDSYDEEKNGVLVLDEAGTWLNSRSFMDRDRQAFIDWMLHARKHGWSVYLQVQDINMIDKQFRTGLAEVIVRCIRADKMRIPVIGQFLGKRGRLPRFHIANHSLADVPGFIMDREFYRNDHLQDAYDTRQVFRSDYPHGVHSVLSAWHLKGRFAQPVRKGFWARMFASPAKPEPKPKLPLVAKLQSLPPDARVAWVGKLQTVGAL